MGDPAVQQANNPLAIEGLDSLFRAEDTPGQDVQAPEDRTPQDIEVVEDTPGRDIEQVWTVDEAAANLGISAKTVLRRLQKGTLKGHKVPGQFGLEWRVAQDTPGQQSTAAQDRTPQDTGELIQLQVKLDLMSSELRELRQQLQGASFRNGYLQAQLEQRDQEIKLLTDSQHKRGWWTSFCSWFLGVKEG